MNSEEKREGTQKCVHEARHIVYDSKEGMSICTNCTLVVGDSLSDHPSQSLNASFLERYDNEEKLSLKAKAIGLTIDFAKQSMLLHDYVENAHLPSDFVEKTGHHSKKVLYSLEINALPRSRMLRISLAEFTALMIYQTMLMVKPKYISDTRWMLCVKCDNATLSENQKKKEEEYERKKREILEKEEKTKKVTPPILPCFSSKIMSERDLCNLMGISTTTLIRGMKTIIHDNDHFDARLLSIYL